MVRGRKGKKVSIISDETQYNGVEVIIPNNMILKTPKCMIEDIVDDTTKIHEGYPLECMGMYVGLMIQWDGEIVLGYGQVVNMRMDEDKTSQGFVKFRFLYHSETAAH